VRVTADSGTGPSPRSMPPIEFVQELMAQADIRTER
jgi:hypothetical protein